MRVAGGPHSAMHVSAVTFFHNLACCAICTIRTTETHSTTAAVSRSYKPASGADKVPERMLCLLASRILGVPATPSLHYVYTNALCWLRGVLPDMIGQYTLNSWQQPLHDACELPATTNASQPLLEVG
jgi:hypothetical protein